MPWSARRYVLLLTIFAVFLPPCGKADGTPALVIKTLDGKTFDLSSFKGHPVIVHFWATWCEPCKEEMPVLESFYRVQHPQGFELIAVSVDQPRDVKAVTTYMRDFHFPAALISDVETNSFDLPGVVPVTYVIDGQGGLRHTLTPDQTKLTEESLNAAILPLLSK